MRTIMLAITAVVAFGLTVPAHAARMSTQTVHRHMVEMKAQDPIGFDACQSLATSRGYRIAQPSEYENKAVMDFIAGCLMGRQR